MSALRVGLVGCGFMGRMHASVYGSLDRAELSAVADKDVSRATGFANEFGAQAMTFDEIIASPVIDAVDVCLPTYLHREFTERAAQAGKHVVCEKPMALNLDDAQAMIDACVKGGVRLMIAHCIRFWPEYGLLKRMMEGGDFGKLLSLNLTRYGEFPSWSSDNWLAEESKAGGGALDMHIHDTDYVLYLFGEPAAFTSAGTVDDRGVSQIFTTMTFPGGEIAHLEGGWNLPPKTPFKMAFRAIFERGAAIMDGGPMTIHRLDGSQQIPEFPKMSAAGGGNISDLGGYFHELSYFVDCVLDGRPFEVTTPESSRLSLELVLAEISKAKQT